MSVCAHGAEGAAPPLAVLDTNVLLGLWLWRDPRLMGLRDALQTGWIRWVVDAATWAEWLHEIRPARCAQQQLDAEQVLSASLAVAPWSWRVRPDPVAASGPAHRRALQCTDPNDQMFVDLALRSQAGWLLTRDRALLRLRRPASAVGLRIVNPDGLPASHWRSP